MNLLKSANIITDDVVTLLPWQFSNEKNKRSISHSLYPYRAVRSTNTCTGPTILRSWHKTINCFYEFYLTIEYSSSSSINCCGAPPPFSTRFEIGCCGSLNHVCFVSYYILSDPGQPYICCSETNKDPSISFSVLNNNNNLSSRDNESATERALKRRFIPIKSV